MLLTLNIELLGNKKDNVTIIYTPWSNLKKDGSMEVGQVSFKDPRKVCTTSLLLPARWRLLALTHSLTLGQASTRSAARESYRQPPQQNEGGEEA
jgi:hypothetical protein